jgi:hypothetical protein
MPSKVKGMERENIAGICLKLKVKIKTNGKVYYYHPRRFGLLYISAGRTGGQF